MSELKIRTRATGACAVLPPGGLPAVTTPTGGTVDVVTAVSAPGFNRSTCSMPPWPPAWC